MMLGLSSRSAPDASFGEILDLCERRGFGALEIEEGHAHGVGAGRNRLEPQVAARLADERGVVIAGYRVSLVMSALVGHETVLDSRLARIGEALGSRLILDGPARLGSRIDVAATLADAGVSAAVVVTGRGCLQEADAAAARAVDLVWDAEPALGALDFYGRRLLDAHRSRLQGIRLAGGGPETAMHEGAGVGELMRHLALAAYAGSVIVSPSSTRYRVAWRTWLGRRGGSGCAGTKPGTTLVELLGPARAPTEEGAPAAAHAAAGPAEGGTR